MWIQEYEDIFQWVCKEMKVKHPTEERPVVHMLNEFEFREAYTKLCCEIGQTVVLLNGFYQPSSTDIYVNINDDSEIVREVLAHEMVHYVQFFYQGWSDKEDARIKREQIKSKKTKQKSVYRMEKQAIDLSGKWYSHITRTSVLQSFRWDNLPYITKVGVLWCVFYWLLS